MHSTSQLNSALHPSGVTKLSIPALIGWGKGGNIIAAGVAGGVQIPVEVRHVCELLYCVYFTYFTYITERSAVMNMPVCESVTLSVCLSVCLQVSISYEPHIQTTPIFCTYMLRHTQSSSC